MEDNLLIVELLLISKFPSKCNGLVDVVALRSERAAIMLIFIVADASYSLKQPNERIWITDDFLLRLKHIVEHQYDL